MAHFVDIETSAEALEEEKELTEAVEALVNQAAVSVWSEIQAELHDNAVAARTWIQNAFPLLVVYQQDRHVLMEHLQALGLFYLLIALAFLTLAPRQKRRRGTSFRRSRVLHRSNSFGQQHHHHTMSLGRHNAKQFLCSLSDTDIHHHHHRGQEESLLDPRLSRATTTSPQLEQPRELGGVITGPSPAIVNAHYSMELDETDEERFAHEFENLYETAPYAKLLLPPACRRVESSSNNKPLNATTTTTSSSHRSTTTPSSSTSPSAPSEAAATALPKKSARKKQQRITSTTATTQASSSNVVDVDVAADTSSTNKLPNATAPEVRDNPALRLSIYWRHFLNLIRYVIKLDFAQAGWTVLQWVMGIWHHRQTSKQQQQQQEEENQTETNNAAQIEKTSDVTEKEYQGATDSNPQDNNETQEIKDGTATPDDDTDATSGVDTTTEEEVVSASCTRCQSPPPVTTTTQIPSDDDRENDETLALASSQRMPSEEDCFHTPAPAVSKPIANPASPGRQAPSMPMHFSQTNQQQHKQHDKDEPHGKATTTSHKTSSTTSPERSSVKRRLLPGLLRPRLRKQASPRESLDSPDLIGHGDDLQDSDTTVLPTSEVQSKESKEIVDTHGSSSQSLIKKTAESPFRSLRHFFDPAHNEEALQKMSVELPVPDRNGYILGDEFLPTSQQTPLLVFVNSRSGPQQGQLLITQLRRLLNPIQVWDLANGGPEQVLESFCVLTRLRILVCGGDGSVAWIISALEKLKLKRKWPPIAILPLGTGNDLARVMGWGGGYNNESLIGILEQISESYISLLDRWEMIIDDNGKKKTKNFFNYFGVGADAEAALQVHYLRESRPEWFFSRIVNKAWYGVFGAEDIIKNTSTALHKDITLYADGVEVPLPSDSQGIIILNIDSYAGGIPIWTHGWRNPDHSDQRPAAFLNHQHRPRRASSVHQFRNEDSRLRRSNSLGDRLDSSEDLLGMLTEEERYDSVTACNLPASCQDGILEVVSIRSLFHLGQIRVGLSNAQRLCQCRHIKIVTRKKVAFQIDGEPWRQDNCVLEIRRKKDPALMLHRSLDDGAETEMSKLLEWAEERNLIDGPTHRILMKEFSRRIESKQATRRRRSGGGVLQNLTRRAIGSTSGGALATTMTTPPSMPHGSGVSSSQNGSQPNLTSFNNQPNTGSSPSLAQSHPALWSSGISF